MAVTKKQVENIAHLARLAVDAAELESYTNDLSNILQLVDELNQINTEHVQPVAHSLAVTQRLREDKVTETGNREQLQSNAPLTEAGLFLVPQVVE